LLDLTLEVFVPGFNIGGQGDGPSAVLETRRNHRWVFETIDAAGEQLSREILLILKTAQRPNFTFEEPEMHHDQEVAYFAGKQTWEPIEISWYDGEQPNDASQAMFDWLNRISDLQATTVATPDVYKKNATLQMTNGQGEASEKWTLFNSWPSNLNWGDLDYEDTEIALIELSIRFDRAQRENG